MEQIQTLKKEKQGIDLAKFICALLIISIHTRMLSSFSNVADVLFNDFFCRIAVALFFLISGYFFFNGLEYSNGKIKNIKSNRIKLKNYFIRMVILYAVWSLIYLLWQIPGWYSSGYLSIKSLLTEIIQCVTNTSYYHMWFIISLIYAVPILYFLLSFISIKKFSFVACALYIMNLASSSYSWCHIPGVQYIEQIKNILPRVSTVFLIVIPMLYLSVIVDKIKLKKQMLYLLTVICFIILVVEVVFIFCFTTNKENFSYMIFTIPFVTLLFVCINNSNIKVKFAYEMRKSSTIIYCLHPLILGILKCILSLNHMDSSQVNSLLIYLIVATVTVCVSFTIVFIHKHNKHFKFLKYIM